MSNSWFSGKFSSWPLEKKIYCVVTGLIYAISILMPIVFSGFYISSYINQSSSIAHVQLSLLAKNFDSALNNYNELAVALTIDNAIQEYVKSIGPEDEGYIELVSDAKNTLQNAMYLYADLMYIAVVSYRFDEYVFKGTLNKITTNFNDVYLNDYKSSPYCRDVGTLRMNYNDAFLEDQKLLNIYFPVYSTSSFVNEIGLLCMIINESLFQTLMPVKGDLKYDSDLILADESGVIVSSSDLNLIGTSFNEINEFSALNGSYNNKNYLYIYRKIGNWKYYLFSKVPLSGMYRDCIILVVLLFTICAIIAYIGQHICRRLIYKTYRPVNDIIKMMNQVADGRLEVRVSVENVGADYEKLADNFNYMMGKIKSLMEQVKREQIMIDQLKFSALQSQIQPHFLYNALESIHWQASADGDKEVSRLVKALAQYYRLCLSKGQDIIPLEKELEHIKNYLIIQNIRYDNKISLDVHIAEDCVDVLIPKITLQPLIENSLYHGIKVNCGHHGKLWIDVEKWSETMHPVECVQSVGNTENIKQEERTELETHVRISVSDNGTGMTDDDIDKLNQSIVNYKIDNGYGIQNVNKRIELLFGRQYGLKFEKNGLGGITVRIYLPDKNGDFYVQSHNS